MKARFLALLLVSPSVFAEEIKSDTTEKQEPRGWVDMIGGGVAIFEKSKGSEEYQIFPVPFFGFTYEGDGESYSITPMGGNYAPIQTPDYGLGFFVLPYFGQQADGPFKKVSPTFELGLFGYVVAFGVLPLNLAGRCDLLQLGHKGCLIDFSIPLDVLVSKRLKVQFIPTLTWGNNTYMQANYNTGESLEMVSVLAGFSYYVTKTFSIGPSYTYISRLDKAREALEGRKKDTSGLALMVIYEY